MSKAITLFLAALFLTGCYKDTYVENGGGTINFNDNDVINTANDDAQITADNQGTGNENSERVAGGDLNDDGQQFNQSQNSESEGGAE